MNHIWDKIFLALLIIGGLNWGLVGIFEFDLVAWLFGGAEQDRVYPGGDLRYLVQHAAVPSGR